MYISDHRYERTGMTTKSKIFMAVTTPHMDLQKKKQSYKKQEVRIGA